MFCDFFKFVIIIICPRIIISELIKKKTNRTWHCNYVDLLLYGGSDCFFIMCIQYFKWALSLKGSVQHLIELVHPPFACMHVYNSNSVVESYVCTTHLPLMAVLCTLLLFSLNSWWKRPLHTLIQNRPYLMVCSKTNVFINTPTLWAFYMSIYLPHMMRTIILWTVQYWKLNWSD